MPRPGKKLSTMYKTQEKHRSADEKRLVLIVDDELINRELLKLVLEDDYNTLTAADGESALEIIRQQSDHLSLIMLDLLMPGMHGLELVAILKEDPELSQIPVIVLTADARAEVQSLQMGAVDFITKPYPEPEVILARVNRIIELSETRSTIQHTERDGLTGLYNREYFYRYARQLDQHHRETDMDAIFIDVHHFRSINERYGKTYGDEVLRSIGERVRERVRDSGGIVCRRAADTFLVYCPHRDDYQEILDNASISLAGDNPSANRVRLRMGVYANVDKSIEMERRFDRAKMAADTVRSNYMSSIALYDNALHEAEQYADRLLEDFQLALSTHQFHVYFQPKFDIRPDVPVLSSAEALVRWIHPELGFINPGKFIPLLEGNGLIQQLDLYVWRETAAQIRDWKERLQISVPVSVNVSRIDMYDPNLIETFKQLLTEYGLGPDELLLEITESAYTQDSAQIISKVNHLRDLGFRIEMDDFGTGYSSLNMISTLPIDALKLDMTFIRNAFKRGGDTRLIEVIIDIADYLSVPVIAEGVETAEQLNALKAMGCDLVQGYYFSKPVPAGEFEAFLADKKRRMREEGKRTVDEWLEQEIRTEDRSMPASITRALSSGFEVIYYVDTQSGRYVEFSAQGKYDQLKIERSGSDFFADCQANILRVVHPEDQRRLSNAMQRDSLLRLMSGDPSFTITYRLMIQGEPVYYSLRAVRAVTRDEHHLVVGICNVDESIRQAHGADQLADRGHAFFAIAQALSSDFESVYYVDTITDEYTEFTAQGAYEELKIQLSGRDFFDECQKNLRSVVYYKDQQKIAESMKKETLLRVLSEEPSFTVTYRLMIDGTPTYYRLKAVTAEDKFHIVIGISNAASQISRDLEYGLSHNGEISYGRIAQALSQDFFAVYYVNEKTEHFIEYTTHDKTHELVPVREGDGFFDDCKRTIPQRVLPADQQTALDAFNKENLLNALEGGKVFTVNYRLIQDGVPIYAGLKAMRLKHDPEHIVVGVSNINAQIQLEQEYEKTKRDSVTFASIAQALAADYFSIYYVDTETDRFIEYSAHDDYAALGIEKGGEDFFNLSRKNIVRVVHPEDHDKILAAFTKEKLLREMEKAGTFTLTYRLMFGDQVNYVAMKATRMADRNDKHIVIGLNNINAQMQRQLEYDAARAKSDTYSRIVQALSKDYYSIYMVNTETDEFVEYSSTPDYRNLQVEQNGVDFFKDCRRNVLRLVYKEDLPKALAVWDKRRLMSQLEDGKTFSATYRIVMDGTPVYINCKVNRMEDELDKKYIVIGISNVDEQAKREKELTDVREKANRDALTGAKSKHAYVDTVAELNTAIDMGTVRPFAVVVCDVNGLKTVNDTLGHQAGDKLIQSASEMICSTYKHSPVFRVGGDEFVAILSGQDYDQRVVLMAEMLKQNRRNRESEGVVIACGASEWRPDEDNRFEAVFDRADAAMYDNKQELKAQR